MKIRIYIILVTLILTDAITSKNVFAQEKETLGFEQINTTIDSITKICNESDSVCFETFSHGQSKFYKNVIGFVKIRYGKGYTFRNAWIIKNQLFKYSYHTVRNKRKKNHHIIDNYYYNDTSLIKYERFVYWRLKTGESDIIEQRIILYLAKENIFEKQIELNDKSTFTDKDIDWILKTAKDTEHEYKEYIKNE